MEQVNVNPGMSADSLRKSLKNLETEKWNYEGNVNDTEESIKFDRQEMELIKERLPLIMKHNKRLDPKYEFENLPENLALQARFDELSTLKNIAAKEAEIRKKERQIKLWKEELLRIEEEIPRTTERLKKAEGD